MLNFPDAPTVNQKYPSPAVAGLPVYTWDGEKWQSTSGSSGGAASIAYVDAGDAATAAAAVAGDALKVAKAGDTMTGLLTLPATTPTAATHATSKGYVDAGDAANKTYAAPFDAMAYNGIQINGSMEVSQENGGNNISVANATKYIVDGWNIQSSGAQVIQAAQSATGPAGFTSCLRAAVITANASPVTPDYCIFVLPLEGYRISRLAWGTANAQPVTIGFWVSANRAGTYSGSMMGGSPIYSYIFSFVINSASTWEYKTTTIPGSTVGTWASGNAKAVHVIISMM